MTDIDFDELDRAVNSLMQQGASKPPVSAPTPGAAPEGVSAAPVISSETAPMPQETAPVTPQNTPEIAPASAPEPPVDAATSVPALESSTPELVAPAPLATPPLATKRSSGRFMDIVAPSSATAYTPKPRTSRVGVSLQPTMDIAPPAATPESMTLTAEDDPVEETSMTQANDMQTPTPRLELSPTVPEEELIPDDAVSDASMMSRMAEELEALEARDVADVTEESPAPAPLESPFVPGAVVDKRPLGNASVVEVPQEGANSQDEQIETSPIVEPAPTQDIWGETPSEQQLATEPLVPELDKDLMALESGASVAVADIENEQDAVDTAEMPAVESKSDLEIEPKTSIDEVPASAATSVASASASTAALVGGDIPQQYTTDLDSEPEPAPVYDAASQVPELTHKEKKKSGWLSVVMILLLFILGGAGGAAAWYFLL